MNVSGWSDDRPPYVSTYGPSQRHVVDMATVDEAGGFIIPGGESGNPLSPHYEDQVPLWRQGRLWVIPLDRAKAARRVVQRMRLLP